MKWFSSDWHLNHTNIAGEKVSNWKKGFRDFNSVYEMNEEIIKTINKYVNWDDELYFLGDLCFGGHKLTPGWRNRINCQTIHWIKGNHDSHADKYKDSFTTVQDYLELESNNKFFILFHYSMRVWLGSHKGYYHLYGHSHSNLEYLPNGKSMDVGIDNAKKLFGEYRPFSEEEIIKILDKRETVFLDQHSSTTNVR